MMIDVVDTSCSKPEQRKLSSCVVLNYYVVKGYNLKEGRARVCSTDPPRRGSRNPDMQSKSLQFYCRSYRTFGLRRLSRLRKSLQTQTFGYPRIAILKILGYVYLFIVSTAKLIVLWVVKTTDPERDYRPKK
jgi:hypothetical protein